MNKKLLSLIAGIALLVPALSQAAGLGSIRTYSYLNEKLNAEIPVLSVNQANKDKISVALASNAEFEKRGVTRTDLLNDLEFKLQTSSNGRMYVKVTSEVPISTPYINFILKLVTDEGEISREFAVFLDPVKLTGAVKKTPTTKTNLTASKERPKPTSQPKKKSITTKRPSSRLVISEYKGTRYGPIRKGETLWSIAKYTRPSNKIAITDMVSAIKAANANTLGSSMQTGVMIYIPTIKGYSAYKGGYVAMPGNAMSAKEAELAALNTTVKKKPSETSLVDVLSQSDNSQRSDSVEEAQTIEDAEIIEAQPIDTQPTEVAQTVSDTEIIKAQPIEAAQTIDGIEVIESQPIDDVQTTDAPQTPDQLAPLTEVDDNSDAAITTEEAQQAALAKAAEDRKIARAKAAEARKVARAKAAEARKVARAKAAEAKRKKAAEAKKAAQVGNQKSKVTAKPVAKNPSITETIKDNLPLIGGGLVVLLAVIALLFARKRKKGALSNPNPEKEQVVLMDESDVDALDESVDSVRDDSNLSQNEIKLDTDDFEEQENSADSIFDDTLVNTDEDSDLLKEFDGLVTDNEADELDSDLFDENDHIELDNELPDEGESVELNNEPLDKGETVELNNDQPDKDKKATELDNDLFDEDDEEINLDDIFAFDDDVNDITDLGQPTENLDAQTELDDSNDSFDKGIEFDFSDDEPDSIKESIEFVADPNSDTPELSLDDIQDDGTMMGKKISGEEATRVQMKLDLAHSFISIAEFTRAKELLTEVVETGNKDQAMEAKKVIESLD